MILGRCLLALVLLALAWSVAVPLTRWFARASWTASVPTPAIVAWQAVGLSGGLAVLTAELTLVASGTSGPWRSAVRHSLGHLGSIGALGVIALGLLALSIAWLLGVLVLSFVRAAEARRTHRAVLDLLAHSDRVDDTAVEVIDTAAPLAYSVPGRRPHVVMSSGARDNLGRAELGAVVAHEHAHLRLRHNVLVQPFIAWELSLPFLATPRLARRRVEQLVEMQCDDIACRSEPAAALRSALAQLAPADSDIDERLARLDTPRPALLRGAASLAFALVLVVLPPALLLTVA